MIESIKTHIDNAGHILVIQADNPDGDSLASALALEELLGIQGKKVDLYCGVEIPSYLRYISGWDRVRNDVSNIFDLSIIVDTGAISLLESLERSHNIKKISHKPCIVIDHHVSSEVTIGFATRIISEAAVSTGQIIYNMAKKLSWHMTKQSDEYVMISILSDSLGFMSESTTTETLRIAAELVGRGTSIATLDEKRRSLMKKSPEITSYKGSLLSRINYSESRDVAFVTIPWEEIQAYSHDYNPSMLVIDDMRMVEGVKVAIAFKSYPDGKITAKIRCNGDGKIADKLASYFGGGGHPYAAGFKVAKYSSLKDLVSDTVRKADLLLGEYTKL